MYNNCGHFILHFSILVFSILLDSANISFHKIIINQNMLFKKSYFEIEIVEIGNSLTVGGLAQMAILYVGTLVLWSNSIYFLALL